MTTLYKPEHEKFMREIDTKSARTLRIRKAALEDTLMQFYDFVKWPALQESFEKDVADIQKVLDRVKG